MATREQAERLCAVMRGMSPRAFIVEGEHVNITRASLVSALAGVYEDAKRVGAEFPVDVRLQVHTRDEDDYTVRWGDASFDTDHRGLWGASTLDHDTILDDLASDLASQAADMGEM